LPCRHAGRRCHFRPARRAEKELGAKFDVKAFHAAVLEHGALPLTVLKNVVQEWIASAPREGGLPPLIRAN